MASPVSARDASIDFAMTLRKESDSQERGPRRCQRSGTRDRDFSSSIEECPCEMVERTHSQPGSPDSVEVYSLPSGSSRLQPGTKQLQRFPEAHITSLDRTALVRAADGSDRSAADAILSSRR